VTRLVLLATLLAGCASAHETTDAGTGVQLDGPPVVVDAPTRHDAAAAHDAAVPHDAHVLDADVPHDARPLDADVHHDAPLDACVPINAELILNPAFDLTPVGSGWTQAPIDAQYPDITAGPDSFEQSPPYTVWLGGIPSEGTPLVDQVYQDIAVPAGTTKLVLTGYYAAGSTEETSGVVDTGSVDLIQTNGTPIENALSLNNLSSGSAYTAFSHTFTSNVAGQTVRLRMTSTNNGDGTGEDYSNFFFDTLALTATYCP
jgi:hypothetical protein